MTLTVPRFEARVFEKNKKIELFSEDGHTILIKDHKTDRIISLVSLSNKKEKNMELAVMLISTIEEFVGQDET